MKSIIIVGIILLISSIGIYFLFKKMKVGKSDLKKLKNKIFKKKISPEQKAFDNGEIIFPVDKRDFVDFNNFKEGVKSIEKISNKLEKIDEDFEEWDPIPNKKTEGENK